MAFFLAVVVLKDFGWKLKNNNKNPSEAKLGIEGRLLWEGNSFPAPESDTLRHRTVADVFFALYTRSLEIGTNALYRDS